MLRNDGDKEEHPQREIVVQITWRQWDDGHWEAWVADESGRSPRPVCTLEELKRWLAQTWGGDGPGTNRDAGPRSR